MSLVVVIAGFVIGGTSTGTVASQHPLLSTANESAQTSALDQLSSADVAVQIAVTTGLEETTSVANYADSVNAELYSASVEDKVIAKPQIVSTNLKSRKDITTYVSVEGDTVSGLASRFGVTSETISGSNNLRSERIPAGTELLISPINGLIYTVKEGDTIDSIAARFRANRNDLIAFNDAEITGGFKAGERILIKDGTIPVPARPAVIRTGGLPWGNGAVYGYNGYTFGYCTWWAATRRAQIGRPVPANLGDAWTWDDNGRRAGLLVNNSPAPGAVIVTSTSRRPGHVAFVEEVLPDGSVRVSEMNVVRWNVRSERVYSADAARGFNYVH